jgi:hypothetical protein
MIPARWDLDCQPGATFEARIVLMLDENLEPVNIDAMTPMAKVRLSATDPVILDLAPVLIAPGIVPGTATAVANSQVITLTAHNLYVGMSLTFSGPSLPRPLRTTERYIIVYKNYTANTFSVISFHAALQGQTAPVRIEVAGSFTVSKVSGQMLIPEKTDEETDLLTDADAKWDLMLEDAAGRRLAPLAKGAFPIKRGMTP